MLIRNIVKELLSVKGSTKEKSEISISGLDNVRDQVDSLGTGESVLIGKIILVPVTDADSLLESVGNPRKEGGINQRGFPLGNSSCRPGRGRG